ncbi:hypothetical protein [Demequina salsinemoris]|uniref:hypothetical protein n=1 Tax=Demequina salsinemoris TaxID=577470 RepID=UPI000785EBAA|nr:hypothetical protein [Demequina salsinemoris]
MREDASVPGAGSPRPTFRGAQRAAATAVAALAAALSGCASGDVHDDAATAASSPTGAEEAASGSTATASSERPACPDPEGFLCLGAIDAARDYTTVAFLPTLTYSVPDDGWFNYEDTFGNFNLTPPGQTLAGINAGTSDFIGVYTSVVAPSLEAAEGCVFTRASDGAETPQQLASWMARRPWIEATEAVPVSIGGLSGVMLEVRAREDVDLPTCHEGLDEVTVGALIMGQDPSSLLHGVIPHMTMRFYLLAYDGGTLAIEISDIDSATATMDQLATVAESFVFDP